MDSEQTITTIGLVERLTAIEERLDALEGEPAPPEGLRWVPVEDAPRLVREVISGSTVESWVVPGLEGMRYSTPTCAMVLGKDRGFPQRRPSYPGARLIGDRWAYVAEEGDDEEGSLAAMMRQAHRSAERAVKNYEERRAAEEETSEPPDAVPRDEEGRCFACGASDDDGPLAALYLHRSLSGEGYSGHLSIAESPTRAVRVDDAPSIAAALRSLADQLEPAPAPVGLSPEDAREGAGIIRWALDLRNEDLDRELGLIEPCSDTVADLKTEISAGVRLIAYLEALSREPAEESGETVTEGELAARGDLWKARALGAEAKLAALRALIAKLDPDHWHATRGVIETLKRRIAPTKET